MNGTTTDERDRQLRKVAVLIANLDDALANRMLSEMPASDAQAVRDAVDRLDQVDADEANAILEEFRSSEPTPLKSAEGVELDASLLARIEQQEDAGWPQPVEATQSPFAELSDAEVTTIVDTLSREHPQTVAVVVSRLDHAVAAKILSRLSLNLQTEVIERVSELDPTDQQSVLVVESHLADWINQQRQRKKRMAAGAELAQRILQSASAEDQTAILTRLDQRNPNLARRFGRPGDAVAETREQSPVPPTKPVRAQFDRVASCRRMPQRATQKKPRSIPAVEEPALADPLGELERLDDATLMEILTQADRQVVTLALAGAGEVLMKRVLRRLPRRQAKEFRMRLRNIGPTRLGDMLAAQQQLALHARQLT